MVHKGAKISGSSGNKGVGVSIFSKDKNIFVILIKMVTSAIQT